MKLNPFSKKSSAYYDKGKAEYDKLNDELARLKKQLESAKVNENREQSILNKLRDSTHSSNTTEQEKCQHQVLSEAHNRVELIESQISQIEPRISPLRRLVEAPEQYTVAKKTLEDLLARQASLNGDLEKTDVLLDKVGQRIAELETRNATETKAAAQSLIANEGEFAMPESLTKLDAELRISKVSRDELQLKREALVASRNELTNSLTEARRIYIFYRAVIIETDLLDQLMPIMDLFARALVARRHDSNGNDESRYAIEVPAEFIESADAALAAEMPG